MKAIVEYTEQEYEQQMDKYLELVRKLNAYMSLVPCKLDELITFSKSYNYAHYTFKGFCTDHLFYALGHEPTPDEIIMIVDGGFSHFGATCHINDDGYTFYGSVNID